MILTLMIMWLAGAHFAAGLSYLAFDQPTKAKLYFILSLLGTLLGIINYVHFS